MDVVAILTDSADPRKCWNKLTDVANAEQLLRLIQSIPGKKAEPFKVWLAQVGYERIEETEDPELAFDRTMKTYLQKGYSKEWVSQLVHAMRFCVPSMIRYGYYE